MSSSQLAYVSMTGPDRVGLISVSLVVWSAMTALCGMAQNFVQLLLARVMRRTTLPR